MKRAIEALQPMGRALMLPIAVLPLAGLLLRLGQPDLLNSAFIGAAGNAIFSHLGMLFAIGVATGFSRDGNGAACLAGIVCFLVTNEGAKTFLAVPPEMLHNLPEAAVAMASEVYRNQALAKLDVPIGIASGLVGGLLYNRFSTIEVPEYLAFFGGKRFVPIASGFAGIVLAVIIGMGFSTINAGIDGVSHGLESSGSIGLFLYGLMNRLLLITGLHHIVNNVVWFVLGDYHGVTGDLRRFFAGDPHAGGFMTGFFPVMMFGLPAACLAMYHEARSDQRKTVAGMFASLALTSFLTGVTEPIEFTFMFLAPILYGVHAVLTGISMALTNALGMHLGFGFSAGLFDYVLNFGKATRPLLLLPIGLAYAALYYGLFRYFIRRLNLKTPGRDAFAATKATDGKAVGRGAQFVDALGGAVNLLSIGACTTRLRLKVADQALVDEARLKGLGAVGIIRPSANALQIVLGPIADSVASEIRDAAMQTGPVASGQAHATTAAPDLVDEADEQVAPLDDALFTALGGNANVVAVVRLHGRYRISVRQEAALDAARLNRLAPMGWAQIAPGIIHILGK